MLGAAGRRPATRHDVGCRPRWNRRLAGPPTRPALAPTRWGVIDHGRRIRGADPGLFVPQVGLAIALKQLWRDHELPGCSGHGMASGGERFRGNAVLSGGCAGGRTATGLRWRLSRIDRSGRSPRRGRSRRRWRRWSASCAVTQRGRRRGTTGVATARGWNFARSAATTGSGDQGSRPGPSTGATC